MFIRPIGYVLGEKSILLRICQTYLKTRHEERVVFALGERGDSKTEGLWYAHVSI